MRKKATLLLAVGAILLGIAAWTQWFTVVGSDDLAGGSSLTVSGGTWSKELVAVALALGAGCLASLTLRKTARRIVGTLAAVIAAIGVWPGLSVFTGVPDKARMEQLLTARANDGSQALHSWATVTEIHTHGFGPALCVMGCGIALLGGVLLALRPGEDHVGDKYQRSTSEDVVQEMAEAPDSGRVMWDALDADIDPTDLPEEGAGRGA